MVVWSPEEAFHRPAVLKIRKRSRLGRARNNSAGSAMLWRSYCIDSHPVEFIPDLQGIPRVVVARKV